MKPFDLEKALAGELVKLRDGTKAIIIGKFLPEHCYIETRPVVGYVLNVEGKIAYSLNWFSNGLYKKVGEYKFDIVGMWEEPRQRVQLDLPCPLKTAEIGQTVYYQIGGEVCSSKFGRDSFVDRVLELGCAFATKEDCQEWINASQRSRR